MEEGLQDFTPISGLVGGMLIGLATALLMLLDGKVAGISGIVGGLLRRSGSEVWWRAMFVAGLLLGAAAYIAWTGETFPVEVAASMPVLVLAGLLVGFGARLGSGCTSGHGVSGMARLSRRSIVATVVFMGTAILTVLVVGWVS